MTFTKFIALTSLFLFAITPSRAVDGQASPVSSSLEPLRFLVGACWRGEFNDGERIDTHCFEDIYGGAHIRDRHTVTGGDSVYRGETIYSAQPESNEISYTYFNSLGGVSVGKARAYKNGSLIFPEHHEATDGSQLEIVTTWEVAKTNDAYVSNTVYNRVDPDGNISTWSETMRFFKTPF